MTLHVDSIEAVWVIVNLLTVVLTVYALREAITDRSTVALLDGKARTIVVTANVRREVLRLVMQCLLLSIVVPGLFIDRPVRLSPIVAALMAVPIVLLVASALDVRDRHRLASLAEKQG